MKRSPLRRYRPRKRKVLWRTGQVKEDSKGMARLRSEAFQRSGGFCECGRPECLALPARLRRVNWFDGQLAHYPVSRARGGSDVLENVRFVKRECHRALDGNRLFWSQPGWMEAA